MEGREIHEGHIEVDDEVLRHRIEENRHLMDDLVRENQHLKSSFRHFESMVKGLDSHAYNHISKQLAHLKAERSELESRIKIIHKDTDRLLSASHSHHGNERVHFRTIAPEVYDLKRKLESLVSENKRLVNEAKSYSPKDHHHNTHLKSHTYNHTASHHNSHHI